LYPILQELKPNWLIVDHYCLDKEWEQKARRNVAKIMVIDDLANREHHCDVLLDQNLNRKSSDYRDLVPKTARLFIGPAYAILRPEFWAYRAKSLERRKALSIKNLLISLGGSDKDNITEKVLNSLNQVKFPEAIKITVILGQASPHKDTIKLLARNMKHKTNVFVGVDNMAAIMAKADLAIGAAGTSAWERCCLGLPTLMLALADNQEGTAIALDKIGAGKFIRSSSANIGEIVLDILNTEKGRSNLNEMVAASVSVLDKNRLNYVFDALIPNYTLKVRRANFGDAPLIHLWKYSNVKLEYYPQANIPTYSQHQKWLAEALDDPRKTLLMVLENNLPVAHIRFERLTDVEFSEEISICVDPNWRRKGRASKYLSAAIAHSANSGRKKLLATIHTENAASLRLFRSLGFKALATSGTFINLCLDVEELK